MRLMKPQITATANYIYMYSTATESQKPDILKRFIRSVSELHDYAKLNGTDVSEQAEAILTSNVEFAKFIIDNN